MVEFEQLERQHEMVKEAHQEFHDPDVRILHWSGDLTNTARLQGATQLSDMVANHTFAPGEQLNVIGHSRGGDVALAATTTLTHKIDNLLSRKGPITSRFQARTVRDILESTTRVYNTLSATGWDYANARA